MKQFDLNHDLEFIYSKTSDIWHCFKNNKIFITGGTGFFGCWLLETIKWMNDNKNLNLSATILTRNYKKFQNKAPHLANYELFNFVEGDITSFNFFQDNFNYLIHLATTNAEETYKGEDDLRKFETVAYGTKRILEFARKNNIKNILVTSSGAVYGKQPVNISNISEDYAGAPSPTDVGSALGHGKRIAEFFCSYYAQKFNMAIKIARCFSFVGPYLQLNIHYAIGNFIRDALNGGPIIVKGDGSPRRSYLYAADLIIWLLTILLKGKISYPYNVGSDQPITLKQLAYLIAQCTGKELKVIIENQKIFSPVPNIYIPSIRRAENDLNLKVFTTLKDGILKTLHYYTFT